MHVGVLPFGRDEPPIKTAAASGESGKDVLFTGKYRENSQQFMWALKIISLFTAVSALVALKKVERSS
jgi:hypothetical protein